MTHDDTMHQPEHGDDDLNISAILTVVVAGALILLIIVLMLRTFVHGTMAEQHEQKVVDPKYNQLADHEIEQRLLLNEYAMNADGKSGRIPITTAMELVVKRHQGGTEIPVPVMQKNTETKDAREKPKTSTASEGAAAKESPAAP